jgi:hypothetical protein
MIHQGPLFRSNIPRGWLVALDTLVAGDYDEAISFARRSVRICRDAPGAHKLIAQAQHGLAVPSGPTAREKAGHTTKCTLMDDVETRYRALTYEAPWDDKNKKINQAYLQDLLIRLSPNQSAFGIEDRRKCACPAVRLETC